MNYQDKIKCVVWDLDNTLWSGILSEDSEQDIHLREDALNTIRELDRRGILNAICSRNDAVFAKDFLERKGIAGYFVAFAINWNSKSSNIKFIAEELNIGVDAIAFIDDDPWERAEVSMNSEVKYIFSDIEINSLLGYPAFDFPVTEMSQMRRKSYLDEKKRYSIMNLFSDDDSFLDFLQIQIAVRELKDDKTITRGLELLQRANQFKLNSNRYTQKEFLDLISSPNVIPLALEYSDQIGNMGIVCCFLLRQNVLCDTMNIIDFAVSCRAAKKRILETAFDIIHHIMVTKKNSKLDFTLNKTPRNQIFSNCLKQLKFLYIDSPEKIYFYSPDITALRFDHPAHLNYNRISADIVRCE